jgi:hypothetical protein
MKKASRMLKNCISNLQQYIFLMKKQVVNTKEVITHVNHILIRFYKIFDIQGDIIMNYKKSIEVLEKLKNLHPTFESELNLVIKTMKNFDKAMEYCTVRE